MIGVAGKPGGGKSLYSLRLILDELLSENPRYIVTNIPLKMDRLMTYLIKRDVHFDPERVKCLDWEETSTWYLWREEGKQDGFELTAWAEAGFGPCLFVIDEAHTVLNSRNWNQKGDRADGKDRQNIIDYTSLHRHLGDEIIWISQSFSAVDKQFRERTQDYRLCRNWAKERFKGFSKGKGFKVYSYLEPPARGVDQEMIQWEKSYKLDLEVARCYSTSMVNAAADTNEKPKGLHMYWLIVFLAVAGFGAVGGLQLAARFFAPKGEDIPSIEVQDSPSSSGSDLTESTLTEYPKQSEPPEFIVSHGYGGASDGRGIHHTREHGALTVGANTRLGKIVRVEAHQVSIVDHSGQLVTRPVIIEASPAVPSLGDEYARK